MEASEMKKTVVMFLMAFVALTGLAMAAEIEGKIQSVDPAAKAMVLEDGTKLVWDDSTTLSGGQDNLKEGAKVKASYEEKDGKNLASNLEVSE
jgi:hypothetical protein